MHTENVIKMQASPALVFSLAADIARWPLLLPHYRWVTVLEERPDERVAEMAARRGPFPVKWTSVQRLFPEQGRITYHHLRGITTGMRVEWQLSACHGGTWVVILHDLTPNSWLLRLRLPTRIMRDFFVRSIAHQTLHHLRRVAEAEEAQQRHYEHASLRTKAA